MIVGITGKIASGKSFVTNFFNKKKVVIFDADKEINNLYNFDLSVIKKVKQNFPDAYVLEKIDKKILRNHINNNYKNLTILMNILLPKLRKKMIKLTKKNKIVVLDIPLLFENKIDKICDFTINVHCCKHLQLKRIKKRNIDINLYKYFNSIQINTFKKNKLSDFNINTGYNKYIVKGKLINLINNKLL